MKYFILCLLALFLLGCNEDENSSSGGGGDSSSEGGAVSPIIFIDPLRATETSTLDVEIDIISFGGSKYPITVPFTTVVEVYNSDMTFISRLEHRHDHPVLGIGQETLTVHVPFASIDDYVIVVVDADIFKEVPIDFEWRGLSHTIDEIYVPVSG